MGLGLHPTEKKGEQDPILSKKEGMATKEKRLPPRPPKQIKVHLERL